MHRTLVASSARWPIAGLGEPLCRNSPFFVGEEPRVIGPQDERFHREIEPAGRASGLQQLIKVIRELGHRTSIRGCAQAVEAPVVLQLHNIIHRKLLHKRRCGR